MLVEFNSSVNSLPKKTDFCVVGSGPAGITVALELERGGRSVILLEGGGLDPSTESQEIYQGDVIGNPLTDLDVNRLRYLGGTSGHWQGWCRPLEEFDFKKKEGFEDAHWPIEKKDLDPFFGKALSILDASHPPDDVVLDSAFGIKETPNSYSKPPVRFGQKYRDRLKASNNITLITNANLTKLDTDGRRILSATVVNYAGQLTSIKAKQFILAMGGIENSRMLLWCNNQMKGKIVDSRSPLGRYWMVHPHVDCGYGLVDLKFKPGFFDLECMLGLTETAKRQLSVLNSRIILEKTSGEDMKGLLRDLLCVAPKVGKWAASLAEKNLVCGARIQAAWEQEPSWNNHVALSTTKRDRFGIPRTVLHWTRTERDLATPRNTLSRFNEYTLAGNHGRLKFPDWVFGTGDYPILKEIGGAHQMGGTRMASTVEKGVVDSNCRVFGQDNLFVAGSSVFPSCGMANPTLTIVQLAVRLAEHLRYV